jgi:hypothetical protein
VSELLPATGQKAATQNLSQYTPKPVYASTKGDEARMSKIKDKGLHYSKFRVRFRHSSGSALLALPTAESLISSHTAPQKIIHTLDLTLAGI